MKKHSLFAILVLGSLTLLALGACKKPANPAEAGAAPEADSAITISGEAAGEEQPAASEQETVMPQDDGIWTVNLDFARKVAEEKQLSLLYFFTGSDWCHWCQKLNEEVLSDETFQQEVVKSFVPVKLDFPRGAKFPQEVQAAYKDLARAFDIQGFPSLVLVDAQGRPYAATGYVPGGPEPYLATLKGMQSGWAELQEKLAGLKEKAAAGDDEAVKEIYSSMQTYLSPYKDYPCIRASLDEYFAICAQGDGDVAREIKRAKAVDDRLAELTRKYNGPDGEAVDPDKADEVAAEYRAVLDEFSVEGEKRQEVLLTVANIYLEVQEADKAQQLVDEAIAAAPDSELAQQFREMKEAQEFQDMADQVSEYLTQGKKEEAMKLVDETFGKAGDNKEKQATLYGMKGELAVLFDDPEEARKNFEKAAELSDDEDREMFSSRLKELDPFNMKVTQSQLLAMQGNPKGMAEAIEEAIASLEHDDISLQKAYVMEGQAWAQAREEDKATECIEKAIALNPESELAQQLQASLAQRRAMQEMIKRQMEAQQESAGPQGEGGEGE